MKKILSLCMVVLCACTTYAQHTITLSIKTIEEKSSLAGATAKLESLNLTTVADSSGIVTFTNIETGTYQIKVSYTGLAGQEITVQVPQAYSSGQLVLLEEAEEH